MMGTRLTKITAMFLAVVMSFGFFVFLPTETSAASVAETSKDISATLNAVSYSDYSARFTNQKKGTEKITVDLFDYSVDPNTIKAEEIFVASDLPEMQGVEFAEQSLFTPDHGKITWNVHISAEQRGMYGIEIEYYPVVDNVSTIERILYLDGAVPFSEARNLSFSKIWQYYYEDENGEPVFEYLTDENGNLSYRQDIGGNDLRYSIAQNPSWRTYICTDSNGFFQENFQFYFAEGDHTITLEGNRESLVIKSISLVPVKETITYEEYLALHADAPVAKGGATIIEAEYPEAVSDTSVTPASDRSSAINSPSSPKSQLFNVIGTTSYNTVGQWARYTFTVEETGFYDMVFRFRQNILEGMFANRAIKLWSSDGMYGLPDGTPTLPFKEATSARFDFSKDWQVKAIGDGSNQFKFYFKEGVTYTVYVEVSLGSLAQIISTVQSTLSSINKSYLNILKLTGASPDSYRDYGFLEIMPDTVRSLLVDGQTITNVSKHFEEICGSKGSQVATLDKVAFVLDKMGRDESEIAPNLDNLKANIGTLGTWLNTSKEQSMVVDYIKIQPTGSKLPRAEASFWQSAWFEIRSFVSSFFADYDSMGITEESLGENGSQRIDVWLAYGRDQSLIWRNMIDSQYTPETGVAVNLKLVAGGTLLPSVLSGQGPDVYIGLGSSDVINYAIRGAIKDVQDFEGFEEVFGYDIKQTYYDDKEYRYIYKDSSGNKVAPENVNFNYANTIPITLYGKTYGVPETSSFPVMFYRLDVLSDLGLDVPKTWDDLLEMAPVLQANNMDIGLANASAVNIFLYQYGGSLWKYLDDEEYAGAQIGLDTDVALDSFRFCTRLYTDYSFPISFDGPNRFRTGEMPIVINDYSAMYNTLTVFATEIKGLWQFTSLPGVIRENGLVNNCSVATLTATAMLHGAEEKGTAEAAWSYMMWQAGADVQASYGNQMVALLGPSAKYATANMNAIKDLSWTSTEYANLVAQLDNLAAIPNYPGSYIVPRYTNFAFLAAANAGADPVDELYSYVTIINKEITRKREEFDLATLEIGETPESARAKNGSK